MADNSSAQEKTEEATPHRKREARKQGTVARSVELTSASVLTITLLALPAILSMMGQGFTNGLIQGWQNIPMDLSPVSMQHYLAIVALPSLGGLALLMSVALIIGVGTTAAQVGLVFSSEALKLKGNRLNPIEGFKRLLSPNALFEALKALAKSLIFGFLAWGAITGSWGILLSLGRVSPGQSMAMITDVIRGMATKIILCWLALSGIDYFFQRKRVDKQLRMSKQELKQEMKQNEQSQEVRGFIARQRRKLSRRRTAQAMKTADVVVTNPTHYAIAIEYDPAKSTAPIVVAKGADLLAAKIRELAKENNVPIVPNPPLARALYQQCEIGDYVPRDLFQPVAEILAYVYKTLRRVRKK